MALLPLSEALANMLERLPSPTKIENLPLDQCANRILADDIFPRLTCRVLIIRQWTAMRVVYRISLNLNV